jgi:6-phosphofructokinase
VKEELRIAVIFLGQQSPGGNNVIDGLLRFQRERGNVKLMGFVNGLNGLMKEEIMNIDEEIFEPFKNLGGYDFLGRSHDYLRSDAEQKQAANLCLKYNLTGLVMIGATHTLSDACSLSNFFLAKCVPTRVIGIPATVNGNIRHNFISTSIGFDTASKVYS